MNWMIATSTLIAGQPKAARLAALLSLCLTVPLGGNLSAADQTRVQVGPAAFWVELAQTEEERRRGLMFRQHLPADQGMLFIQAPGRAEFWMKNTLIPLDLLYFDTDGILLQVVSEAQASAAVSYILEINGGEAARQAIQVGDPLGGLPAAAFDPACPRTRAQGPARDRPARTGPDLGRARRVRFRRPGRCRGGADRRDPVAPAPAGPSTTATGRRSTRSSPTPGSCWTRRQAQARSTADPVDGHRTPNRFAA
jgi:uncharacterized protein